MSLGCTTVGVPGLGEQRQAGVARAATETEGTETGEGTTSRFLTSVGSVSHLQASNMSAIIIRTCFLASCHLLWVVFVDAAATAPLLHSAFKTFVKLKATVKRASSYYHARYLQIPLVTY